MSKDWIWVEKYRPKNIDQYACDDRLKKLVKNWIEQGQCPNMILAGPAGTGKTTLARLLAKSLSAESIEFNSSSHHGRGIDVIRDKVQRFAMMQTHGKLKIVILDEYDHMTPDAQWVSRGVIEGYTKGARFILTCNYLNKIIPEIQSRCKVIPISSMPKKEMGKRCLYILKRENIKFEVDDLTKVIKLFYPDMREILNTLQMYSGDGKLEPDISKIIDSNYRLKIVDAIKSQDFNLIRQTVKNEPVDFVDILHFLFNEFGDNRRIMLIVADHLYTHINNPIPEINFLGCVLEIMDQLKKEKKDETS